MAVPYTFGSATSSIPLSQLDSNFATTITLGNTAIQLGNTVTTLNNMTLANVAISSTNGDITINTVRAGLGNASISTNTVFGASALPVNTTGATNTAIGNQALNKNTTGSDNSAVGLNAIYSNTTGGSNTSIGRDSLFANTTASNNTAVGYQAAYSSTGNGGVTAIGAQAGYNGVNNSSNAQSVFVGYQCGYNTTGVDNTFVGAYIGKNVTNSGAQNVSMGAFSSYSLTTGGNNTTLGYQAGYGNTTGNYNTFLGNSAGYNTTGGNNVFIGQDSGYSVTTGTFNTFIGRSLYGSGQNITTGSKNTIIGGYNGNQGGLDIRTTSNNIVLSDGDGNPRLYYIGADTTWKSKEIYNFTSANSANMYIGSGYDIGRGTSALKYKQDIRDIESIDISKFRPVRYKSKCANDDQTKDYFGFIADWVDEAGFKELVSYNAEGEVESFAYDRMTVVLTKALQDLKSIVDAQAATITQLQETVATLQAKVGA